MRAHLQVEIQRYDAFIRRVIPGYDAMLSAAATAVAARPRELVVELGTGTGALSAELLGHDTVRRVRGVDADAAMLAQATRRLSGVTDRIELVHGSFDDPLPPCDAVAASLALHHVRVFADKAALFQRIADALRDGGVFVNADVTIPDDPDGRDTAYARWIRHMTGSGFTDAEAQANLRAWADEDSYFSKERELTTLAAAGLDARCVWEDVPATVIVATKP